MTEKNGHVGLAVLSEPEKSPTLLALEGVDAGYGETIVLRQVDIAVRKGEIVALLGHNGAGKTTTLRTISGLIGCMSGKVMLNGVDVTSLAPNKRSAKGLCLIPEGRGVFRSLTVRENLKLQASGAGKKTNTFDEALSIFPVLGERMDLPAGLLSGGQQQMLALARAYQTNPQVVLLDEPSMGLAPLVVEEIFRALGQLAATGVAMVIVEQYVVQAMSMADTVVLLRRGSVSYAGPPEGLDEERVLRGYLGAEFEPADTETL